MRSNSELRRPSTPSALLVSSCLLGVTTINNIEPFNFLFSKCCHLITTVVVETGDRLTKFTFFGHISVDFYLFELVWQPINTDQSQAIGAIITS